MSPWSMSKNTILMEIMMRVKTIFVKAFVKLFVLRNLKDFIFIMIAEINRKSLN